MTTRITAHEWEMLSAYLDGELSPAENSHLEAKLQTRPDLRNALEDLRRTQTILRSQPEVRAPRNFLLTPTMVAVRQVQNRSFRLFSTMRLASALATALLMLVLVGDFLAAGRSPVAIPQAYRAFRSESPSAMKAAPQAYSAPVEQVLEMPVATEEPMVALEAAPVETAAVTEALTEPELKVGMQAYPPAAEGEAPTPFEEGAAAALPAPLEESTLVTPQSPPRPTATAVVPAPAVADEALRAAPAELPAESAAWPGWRILEVLLTALALGTGFSALLIRRSLRG